MFQQQQDLTRHKLVVNNVPAAAGQNEVKVDSKSSKSNKVTGSSSNNVLSKISFERPQDDRIIK